MIAVETVIRKLVSDYEFVIIPGFGALLSRQIHASFDKNSGVFSPPVKKLAFNEFLKLDDGLLANYISREEKVSHLEAVGYVKQYADTLRSALNTYGETKINGVGRFQTNGEGKLVFEPNTENHFKDEWYGFSKVTAKTFDKVLTTSTVSANFLEENDAEVIEFSERKTVRVNWFRWAAAAVLAGLMFYVSFFLVTANEDNYKSTLNPFDNLFGNTASTVVVKEPVQLSESKVDPTVADSVVVETAVKPDSIIVEVPPVPAVAPVEAAQVGKQEISFDKKFYLIAGAFKGMKRANILLEDLQSKGYTDALVIPAGKHSSKVTVAVQGFDQERDAYQASSKLKKVIGEEGWVMKIK
ncbi:HU domain-containing protein [Dyadobacter psychrotolerans]|uniref:SPOR domain-containing protein n=1 Tax=Dyadobacter psychrotolerans TaxID=2541721 RepID=A0A4R5DYG2_9BACT|nr:SPOR domain-containing protein [Dyadobacter psychrotolerans]TDE17754.1 SPOR domain-containing protein [Dyadobacter psychrotolerans]